MKPPPQPGREQFHRPTGNCLTFYVLCKCWHDVSLLIPGSPTRGYQIRTIQGVVPFLEHYGKGQICEWTPDHQLPLHWLFLHLQHPSYTDTCMAPPHLLQIFGQMSPSQWGSHHLRLSHLFLGSLSYSTPLVPFSQVYITFYKLHTLPIYCPYCWSSAPPIECKPPRTETFLTLSAGLQYLEKCLAHNRGSIHIFWVNLLKITGTKLNPPYLLFAKTTV